MSNKAVGSVSRCNSTLSLPIIVLPILLVAGLSLLMAQPGYKILPASGESFGRAIAMQDNWAMVGDPRGEGPAGQAEWGRVYVYRLLYNGWLLSDSLFASDGQADDDFGTSVDISGNYAVVGANRNVFPEDAAGKAYIFFYDGSKWVEEAILSASDGFIGNNFGNSVSIDGTRAVVGASSANGPEAAYVFNRVVAGWIEEAKLVSGDSDESFGVSVSISGDNIVVGAAYDDDQGNASGSAYFFTFSGSNWSFLNEVYANNPHADHRFGLSVSINGTTAAIGGPQSDLLNLPGDACIFTLPTGAGSWLFSAAVASSDGNYDDYFGQALHLDGDSLLVGAWGGDTFEGAAYLYAYDTDLPGQWAEVSKFVSSDGQGFNAFGQEVAFTSECVLVGAPWDTDAGGAVYSFYCGISNGIPVEIGVIPVCCWVPPIRVPWWFLFTNELDEVVNIRYWAELTDPRGRVRTVLRTRNVELEPGASFSKERGVNLRDQAVHGEYLITMFTEIEGVITSASAVFEVTGEGVTEEGPGTQASLDGLIVPERTELLGNFPNPFNPSTDISYQLSEEGLVTITVYDILGREVRRLAEGAHQAAGSYSVTWNATNAAGYPMPSGMYFYRMSVEAVAGDNSADHLMTTTRKMLLSR